jgi:hypothetical protein
MLEEEENVRRSGKIKGSGTGTREDTEALCLRATPATIGPARADSDGELGSVNTLSTETSYIIFRFRGNMLAK